jgi:hypothetical protein
MAVEQFEIQVCRGGRWSIEGVSQNQKDAIDDARRRLGGQGVEAVQVIKEASRRFGKPEVVFEQKGRSGDSEVITVAPIDAAPQRCEQPKDLFKGDARQTMAKLFKNYSSKMNITVSEVLYNARELKRVMEKDNLVSSAVSRVASLQSAGESAQAAKARRDDLFTMLDQVLAKANATEKVQLPSINAVGFKALEEAVALQSPDPDEAEYLKRVAISRELIDERSFLGKLDNAIRWVEGAAPDVAVSALDDFIADTLNDASLVQDLLGPRENLLAAILAMLDLLDGQMALAKGQEEQRKELNASAERLNKLIGEARLPGAVEVLTERIRMMVASKNTLVREGTPAQEKAALRALVERIVPAEQPVRASVGLLDGLIERGARMLNIGGEAGRLEALAYLANLLQDPPRRLRFLIHLWESSLRGPLEAKLEELIKGWIGDASTAGHVNPETKNPALIMRAVTNLFYRIKESGLSDALRQKLSDHLDNLLYKYVVTAQILERIDDPAKPLRTRARMLMSMCLPDMLPPGKAVEAARPRVVAYLRQPNFTAEVVADISDPVEKEKTLREFFDLMRKAGFQ